MDNLLNDLTPDRVREMMVIARLFDRPIQSFWDDLRGDDILFDKTRDDIVHVVSFHGVYGFQYDSYRITSDGFIRLDWYPLVDAINERLVIGGSERFLHV